MPAKAKKQKPTSLAHGRPPGIRKPTPSLSSKATRTLIRGHHQLHKALAQAEQAGDHVKAASLKKQIEEYGGLKSYQQASIQGQSNERGGDTSKVLLDWLRESLGPAKSSSVKPRMLEVGALSTTNACSLSGLFEMTCIDLNSQAKGIEQQDFMERPLPNSADDKFDIISLSLVLNYVPDHQARGQMLHRTLQFLRQSSDLRSTLPSYDSVLPSLFLVLPAPCVTNSRYLNEAKLTEIMESLGYKMTQRKLTTKLIYYLWLLKEGPAPSKRSFHKREINPGMTRNNFCVTMT
ncbi:25S rRNA (adenine2142-N1)-methyltransferase [Zalaria obscura]|uniref:25S rRNA (Adenine2142-N1)-methyltransferase n=1 Tax=Zalaria obscura TaxID=2024903 RepID=A0ACC3SIG9_9PEZI